MGASDSPRDFVASAESDRVLAAEKAELGIGQKPVTGLALSGGGVRSASFALGVVQALLSRLTEERDEPATAGADAATAPAEAGAASLGEASHGPRDQLERFDYLSTVSGGGFLGLALLWLRANEPSTPGRTTDYRRHLRSKHSGVRTRFGGLWLDYFRQHGNYLLPRSLSVASLLWVALRNLIVSGGVYFGLATVAMVGAIAAGLTGDSASVATACARYPALAMLQLCSATDARTLAAVFTGFLVAAALAYSLATWIASMRGSGRWAWALAIGAGWLVATATLLQIVSDAAVPAPWGVVLWTAAVSGVLVWLLMLARLRGSTDAWIYPARFRMQQLGGLLLTFLLALLVIASLRPVHALLDDALSRITLAGVLSAIGVAGGYYQALAGRSKDTEASALSTTRVLLTALALIYGLLFGAYVLARHWDPAPMAALATMLALLLVGFLLNLNLLSSGRMYRDRLMETFLPDARTIASNTWELATGADGRSGMLARLWQQTGRRGLYPLVNTNVVLVDSESDTYRNRGGDSFLLSPLYCGSDATGWVPTGCFADKELTAATAMATSGAAANPNSGPGGQGITRNRLVSFLMFFLQVQLGVWVSNPYLQSLAERASSRGIKRARTTLRRTLIGQRPNLLYPGIVSGLFGRRLKETTHFVELTDGGHFDNTGIYELIRRRAKLIIASQASADPHYAMADLANAVRKIRIDFGVHLRFDQGIPLDDIPPSIPGVGPGAGRLYAKRGYAVARIDYPPDPATDSTACEHGWLVYLQATPVRGVTSDVHSYYRACPAFPNQSTADQFFDEEQVEAYRELGYAVAKQMLDDVAAEGFELPQLRDCLEPLLGLQVLPVFETYGEVSAGERAMK